MLEIAVGLVLIGAAAVVVTQSLPAYEGEHRSDALGPGFFPLWIAVIVIVLSLVLIARTCLFPEKLSSGDAVVQAAESSRPHRLHLVVIMLMACAYVALIPVLGFGAASFLLTASYMRLERAPWLQTLGVAFGCVALGVVARDYAFIQLPAGFVGL